MVSSVTILEAGREVVGDCCVVKAEGGNSEGGSVMVTYVI